MNKVLWIIGCVLFLQGCSKKTATTFEEVVEQLQDLEGLEVLQDGESMLAISGPLQGRVLTSSANGAMGRSHGWMDMESIQSKAAELPIAYMGGESRLWFAPEFGQFSLFFDKGAEQVDENMRAPRDLDYQRFTEVGRRGNSVTYAGELALTNASENTFKVRVERTITLFSKTNIEQNLGMNIPEGVSFVGFSAASLVRNVGQDHFEKEKGLISIWELGCMLTAPDNVVVIPVEDGLETATAYFAPITHRTKILNDVLYYKADAREVNKIGVKPKFSKNVMGSYSAKLGLLNIVTFNKDQGEFVNSVPKHQDPYDGDLINIFNGEVTPELGRNWPFYEFESSSSAKELMPGDQLCHWQSTYHFEGEKENLNPIAMKILGVSLDEIPTFE